MQKRPIQDESLFNPFMRKLYTRTTLGRKGDSKEEYVKYTQSLSERVHYEAQSEWMARLHEYTYGCEKPMKVALSEEKEPEEFEEATKDLVFSAYPPGIFPSIPIMPARLIPSTLNQVIGMSADISWVCMDEFTLENLWVASWHLEGGTQADNDLWYLDEDWKAMQERRHMRTGEKFKYLCVQRSFLDGAGMVTDILKDVRNELHPEYSEGPFFYHGYVNNMTVDAQFTSRNGLEISHLMNMYITPKMGFPYQSYNCFLPLPNLYDLMTQLPPETVPAKILGLYVGTNIWMSNFTLSHLETSLEVFGEEMIPPTAIESFQSTYKYGTDSVNYPASFKQSKYVYGQEASCKEPTEYPCPQKILVTMDDATKLIEKSREDHSDWLAV